ncbi:MULTISPECIES: hypothetical protein [Acetobacter]|uniref:Uncharacterized protein n=1 Tax=Acetobacter lovaniensis TaxID=104100 RepID=A0A841QFW2_9PROT|nr:hypothetical protein [Acetobacter lovaniensis]MBB6457899.1 hypothetical protein [Acetobacter lovaniensis]NHN82162.1 hypothetical protein [Acetobacter lovaniensis]GBQ66219.1 hypothetical protein AA0474_1055 [Acetobacter lovaniensis NRIC 0474]
MSDTAKTLPLTVTLSFSEGLPEGIADLADLIAGRLRDFGQAIVNELPFCISETPEVSPAGRTDNLTVVCGISAVEFDRKLEIALKRALESFTSPPLTEDYGSGTHGGKACDGDDL